MTYLPQENFERALGAGHRSLALLVAGPPAPTPVLATVSTEQLRHMAWDLEAIGAAVRLELINRETREPVDVASEPNT